MLTVVSGERFCDELIRDVPFSQALINTFQRYVRDSKPYEGRYVASDGIGLAGQTESGYTLRLNHKSAYNAFQSTELLLVEDGSEKSSFDERVLQTRLSNSVRVGFDYSNREQGFININGTGVVLERTPILLPEPHLERSCRFGAFVYEVHNEVKKELRTLREVEGADRQVEEMFYAWHRGLVPFRG